MKTKEKIKELKLSEMVISTSKHENGIPKDGSPALTVLFGMGKYEGDQQNKIAVSYGFAFKSDKDDRYVPRIARGIALSRLANNPGIFAANLEEINRLGVSTALPILIAIDIQRKLDSVVFKKIFHQHSRTKKQLKAILELYIESYFRGGNRMKKK